MRTELLSDVSSFDVVVTTYKTLRDERSSSNRGGGGGGGGSNRRRGIGERVLLRIGWRRVVLDEMQVFSAGRK